MRLQRSTLLVLRGGNVGDDRFEQRFKIVVVRQGAVSRLVGGGVADLRSTVNHRQVKQRVKVKVNAFFHDILCQAEQQVSGFADDFGDTGVGTVGLVDAQDDRQLRLKRLAQHETGLRQRAFGCVDEQHHAVNHRDAALDLAAEIGVARGIDHVDGDAVRFTVLRRERAGVLDRRVLGENGDALLTFQIVGIHDTIRNFLTFVEHVGLLEHGVNQGGLAVIDVRYDCHITDITANCHQLPLLIA